MYKERRNKLLSFLPDYSIAILTSGKAPYSIGDEKYPFKVDRSFYYYTGIDYENIYLVLIKLANGATDEMLFIEPFDERQAKWVGGRIKADEAEEISNIDKIDYLENLESTIGSLISRYGVFSKFTLWADLAKQELNQHLPIVDLLNKIKSLQPDVEIANIYQYVARMRLVKDESEIANLRKAIEVTKEGIETMMSYSHENIWENELEAYFDYTLKCHQCDHSFATICATGKNATILHYSKNNQYAKTDELVLCDLGASYNKYNADITRTFPVNGKFTERQKQIYDIVLRGNKLIQSIAKAGVTTRWLNQQLIAFYETELANIGLLDNGKKVFDYYWHGVSHTIGLETHDVSLINEPLPVGAIISNEPGLYLEDEGIGIRIEDDLLILEDGCENLSVEIMKEIDEIEAFMAKHI